MSTRLNRAIAWLYAAAPVFLTLGSPRYRFETVLPHNVEHLVAFSISGPLKPAEHFTTEDKRLFSGRLYLWSQYIEAFLDGDIVDILVGFGPDAWVGRCAQYIHLIFVRVWAVWTCRTRVDSEFEFPHGFARERQ